MLTRSCPCPPNVGDAAAGGAGGADATGVGTALAGAGAGVASARADPDRIDGGTRGEGGFSSLAGGRFPGGGSSDDAPNYGDWLRHSTGGTSGALGHEGFDFDGENTWGESQRERERPEADSDSPDSNRGDQ